MAKPDQDIALDQIIHSAHFLDHFITWPYTRSHKSSVKTSSSTSVLPRAVHQTKNHLCLSALPIFSLVPPPPPIPPPNRHNPHFPTLPAKPPPHPPSTTMLSNLIFGPSSAPSSFSSFPSPGTLPSSTSSPLSNDVRYEITDATPDGNVSMKALPRYIVPEEPASSSSDDGFTTDGSSSSSDPLLDILVVDEKDPNACDYYLQGEQQIYPQSPTPPMTTTTNTNNPKRRRSKVRAHCRVGKRRRR